MADDTPTFASVLQEQKLALVKSNLHNLASAHVSLSEEVIRIQKEIAHLHALQAEIETMGQRDPTSLHHDEIRELYDRAMNIKHGRRR